jgi:hypothetical protein
VKREELTALGVAAADRGNALFLDEGDTVAPQSVVFAPMDGGWTVYTTDHTSSPVETTRRWFTTEEAAFDDMYEQLREQSTQRIQPSIVESFRRIGVLGTVTAVMWLVTGAGWLWMSPFTFSRAETRGTGNSGDLGEFIFPAETGLPVVAACYSLAFINVLLQWGIGRRDHGAVRTRAVQIAGGTAFFAAVALVCMAIRAAEVDDLSFWFPPILAVVAGIVVSLALFAARTADAERDAAPNEMRH